MCHTLMQKPNDFFYSFIQISPRGSAPRGVGDAKGGRALEKAEKTCFFAFDSPISPFGALSLRAFLSPEKEMRKNNCYLIEK